MAETDKARPDWLRLFIEKYRLTLMWDRAVFHYARVVHRLAWICNLQRRVEMRRKINVVTRVLALVLAVGFGVWLFSTHTFIPRTELIALKTAPKPPAVQVVSPDEFAALKRKMGELELTLKNLPPAPAAPDYAIIKPMVETEVRTQLAVRPTPAVPDVSLAVADEIKKQLAALPMPATPDYSLIVTPIVEQQVKVYLDAQPAPPAPALQSLAHLATKDEITTIIARIADVETSVSLLASASRVEAIQGKVELLEVRIKNLSDHLDQVYAHISSVNTWRTAATGDIQNLQAGQSKLQAQVTDEATKLKSLSKIVSELNEKVADRKPAPQSSLVPAVPPVVQTPEAPTAAERLKQFFAVCPSAPQDAESQAKVLEMDQSKLGLVLGDCQKTLSGKSLPSVVLVPQQEQTGAEELPPEEPEVPTGKKRQGTGWQMECRERPEAPKAPPVCGWYPIPPRTSVQK